jgi:predicted dehydrogenase
VELHEGGPVPVQGAGEEVSFADEEPLQLECQAFLEALATRRPPVTDGHSGLRVLQVLQAAQRSLVMNGEPVPLPLETFSLHGVYAAL